MPYYVNEACRVALACLLVTTAPWSHAFTAAPHQVATRPWTIAGSAGSCACWSSFLAVPDGKIALIYRILALDHRANATCVTTIAIQRDAIASRSGITAIMNDSIAAACYAIAYVDQALSSCHDVATSAVRATTAPSHYLTCREILGQPGAYMFSTASGLSGKPLLLIVENRSGHSGKKAQISVHCTATSNSSGRWPTRKLRCAELEEALGNKPSAC